MDKNKTISRRDFFKQIGAASVAVAGFSACGKGNKAKTGSAEPLGEMTHRTLTGDHVSLLGYGCMRWPMLPSADGKSEVIDQETVNGLVDYALAHGVNYFDTAPPYCQGLSEEATGIALSRHPRDSYYIATKMSNHRLYGAGLRGKELHDASVKMYHNSFKSLRTDNFDYYLFHILGTGAGMEEMRGRLYDCGIADFILRHNIKINFLGPEHTFQFLKGNDKINLTAHAPSGSFQLFGRAWTDEHHAGIRMFFFNHAGSGHHGCQLIGNVADHFRKIFFRQHGPRRTTGCQQERKLPGSHLFHIVMRLGDRPDIRAQRHFIYFRKAHFPQGSFDIPRSNVVSELTDKCRSDLRNDLLAFRQCPCELEDLRFI